MIRRVLFEAHWLLGITAGLVIAVVGFTGGMLSFEHDIQRWVNPGLMTVEPGDAQRPLTPGELYDAVRKAQPERQIQSLVVSSDPEDAARVVLAPAPRPDGEQPRGRVRGETRYVDPYTGVLLEGEVRGQAFFRVTEDLHRRLAGGDTGKQIVGACTIVLIVLALSGLYLRWPRRLLDWRVWLKPDFSRQGRSFLWSLHSVIGTWVLPVYVLASLTGLFWSYEWYRDGLFRLSGVERPAARQGPPAAAPAGQQAGEQAGSRGGRDARPAPAALEAGDVDRVWELFRGEVVSFSTATMRLPERPGQPFQMNWLDADPPHERASNRAAVDLARGVLVDRELYADKTLPQRLMSSMLPLHSGSYFGLPGLVLVMIASLLMPLFFITGWMLYLDRRRKRRAARAERATVAAMAADEPVLVGFASQSGSAERIAWQTAQLLQGAGVPATVRPLGGLDPMALAGFDRALFVVSTFGDGQAPDNARTFARWLTRDGVTALRGMAFGVLALGDRHYPDFCGFGRSLDEWLKRHGAKPLFERIDVDRLDGAALEHWQRRVGALGGGAASTEPKPIDVERSVDARFGRGRLLDRRLLNQGSRGAPVFHLALAPDAANARWKAGDLVEVIPRHPQSRVDWLLAQTGLDGDVVPAGGERLRDLIARSELPDPQMLRDAAKDDIPRLLRPLQPRRYSIASLPEDGSLQLLVRVRRSEAGVPGVSSAWLTEHVRIGGEIEMRVVVHPSFHGPSDGRPLILIGNGTGIAGLRAHLKQRIRDGHRRNWLIFGERNAACDHHFREEIELWQSEGWLTRTDLAFSRDGTRRIYVQDRLAEAGDELRRWIGEGATILVCGSVQGMACGVDRVLGDELGEAVREQLAGDGRYRRDVY